MSLVLLEQRKHRSVAHPYLAAGNLAEGIFGLIAVGAGIWMLFTYGFGWIFLFSLLFDAAMAGLAFASAYHLV